MLSRVLLEQWRSLIRVMILLPYERSETSDCKPQSTVRKRKMAVPVGLEWISFRVIRQSVILQILHESLLLLFAHLPVFCRRAIVPDEQGPILGRRMACALAGRVGARCGVAHRIVAGPLGVSRCLIDSRLLCDRLAACNRLPACCRLFCRSWFSSVWGRRRLAVGGRLTVGYLLAVGYRLPACCRLANSVVG